MLFAASPQTAIYCFYQIGCIRSAHGLSLRMLATVVLLCRPTQRAQRSPGPLSRLRAARHVFAASVRADDLPRVEEVTTLNQRNTKGISIIFSLNSVLVDTLETFHALYKEALLHFGLTLNMSSLEDLYSSRDMSLLDPLLVAAARKTGNLGYIIGFNRRRDQVLKEKIQVHRYAARSLAWLSEPKAVVDWLPLQQTELLLEASGLAERFKPPNIISYSGERFEAGLIRAAMSLESPPASIIVVESSPAAIARAAALDFRVVGIALATTANFDNDLSGLYRAGATLAIPDFRYLGLAVDSLRDRRDRMPIQL